MIAKGKSISHLSASIQYALRREEAVILDKNIVSETPHQVAKEFKLFQQLNQRCERNSFSFVLSPTINDGKKLSSEQLETINKAFLEKMNLQDHQYIAFVHKNTAHKHIHLYVNRIDYTGKAYDDQFISNRSAHVAEGIAKDMGLKTAKEVQQGRSKERHVEHPEMEYIKELAKATLAQQGVNSVSKFVNSFNQAGFEAGLRAEAYNNKNGSFQGLRFYAGEHRFKASQIDRSLSKQNIENHFQQITSSIKKEKYLEVNGSSMPSRSINLLPSIMIASLSANRIVEWDEDENEEKKKKLKKKRGFGMGR
jgi:hypothetical protein